MYSLIVYIELLYDSTVEALKPLLKNELVAKLAQKYNKTPAQICLRWAVQKDVVVLPKSIKPERVFENGNVILFINLLASLFKYVSCLKIFDFEITDEDMKELKGLNKNYRVYGVEV